VLEIVNKVFIVDMEVSQKWSTIWIVTLASTVRYCA